MSKNEIQIARNVAALEENCPRTKNKAKWLRRLAADNRKYHTGSPAFIAALEARAAEIEAANA